MAFKWKDEYSCNIEEIDKQHKRLFELGGKIYTIASIDDGADHYDEIVDVLEELKSYTQYHFNYEEQIMQDFGYDNYDTHKIEHDFFIKKVQRIGRKDLEGQQSEAIIEIVTFVADWVASHILKTDKEYVVFFNGKGIK